MATSAAALVAVGAAMAAPATASPAPAAHEAKPTVVLVHGAFADSSGFKTVIARLTQDGYPVRTVSNPLRGLPTDTAAAKDVLRSIQGPIVLVGHSYGGAVITNAAAGDPDVKALVYLAALVPDVGETPFGPSDVPIEHPAPPQSLVEVPTVAADGTAGDDLYLAQDGFRATFAADVDPATAAAMAATQRPVAKAAVGFKTTAAAWRTIPSWNLITENDQANAPEMQEFFAKRANSHIEEVNSSHAVYVSHPDAVVKIIEDAARGTR
ncbi:alpha/beta hydrolase [Streptomyces canus]|uniref:alpha/beta hydrolase n=1 Tax=Streptomyces canus TaxID=58343 RepID=UPI000379B494|nr:alpha/beta hydrolase [Streptomyces canus]